MSDLAMQRLQKDPHSKLGIRAWGRSLPVPTAELRPVSGDIAEEVRSRHRS